MQYIIAHEADRIHQIEDMLSISKEGYAIGGKSLKSISNTFKQEFLIVMALRYE